MARGYWRGMVGRGFLEYFVRSLVAYFNVQPPSSALAAVANYVR